MSFLSPWFLLGLLAVALPVWVHLQRRRSRQEQPFSSLRFVRAAPPRLERRRRVEHWLLLAVRGLVVMVLAAAFARPLFTRPLPGIAPASGHRRLLLLDASASMRRTGLWPQALARARAALHSAGPGDRLAVMTFADRAQVVLGFEEWAAAPAGARVALAEARMAALAPGWGGTDLGVALVAAAEVVADDGGQGGGRMAEESVVLVSDLGEGARLGALGPREWPAGLGLRLERLAAGAGTNLGVAPVPEGAALAEGEGEPRVRARVTASAGQGGPISARLHWSDGGPSVAVQLSPGDSRVVEAPQRTRAAGPGTLVLQGDADADAFDNRLAVAPVTPARNVVIYIGASTARQDSADASGDFYFLSRAFPKTRARAPQVVAHRPDDAALSAAVLRADLVVLAVSAIPLELGRGLRRYLEAGRTLVFVPPDPSGAVALGALTGATGLSWSEAQGREAVLTGVDLGHPLLQPFADGRSADFTHVRFWHHRVVDVGALRGARVLARFDDGSAAWATVPVGRGQIFLMTSGFAPRDSQLGLSSKLVPLLFGLLDASAGAAADLTPRFVGDALPLAGGSAAVVVRPDGARVELPAGAQRYADTSLPGHYRITTGGADQWFAVNVPPAESASAPLALEALERAGIPIGEAGAKGEGGREEAGPARGRVDEQRRRAELFAGLEAAQKPWRWGLLAVLLLAIGESLLTLRAGRARDRGGEAAA